VWGCAFRGGPALSAARRGFPSRCEDSTAAAAIRVTESCWAFVFRGVGPCRDESSWISPGRDLMPEPAAKSAAEGVASWALMLAFTGSKPTSHFLTLKRSTHAPAG
jgi:hypothetical protein